MNSPNSNKIVPRILRLESGMSGIFFKKFFILLGKQKYGNPSIIITIPKTQRKYLISSSPLIFLTWQDLF